MLDPAAAYVNVTGVFPDVLGVNASAPAATDGFEFIANFVNDNNLGQAQMILNRAGLTPNGVLESDTASQIKDALLKGFGGAPGMVQQWHLAAAATTGYRCLFLNGQGILRANYTELDVAVYVGDANNAAVEAAGGAYYHADDAAGTIPNIAGVYLILPESRGYVPRGLDTAASVDPDGASRYLGDNQENQMLQHAHKLYSNDANSVVAGGYAAGGNGVGIVGATGLIGGAAFFDVDSASNPIMGDRGGSTESRGANFATKFVVWY